MNIKPRPQKTQVKSKESNEKISINIKYITIAAHINGALMEDVNVWKTFHRKFHVLIDEKTKDKARVPLEEHDGGVVRYIDIETVAEAIVYYTANVLNMPDYYLSFTQALVCAKTWLAMTDPIAKKPELVLWKSDEGLAFSRLPWNYDPMSWSKHPLFDEWLSRTTNSKAFCMWLGSLLFKDSNKEQYVWLYSEGGTGKGSMLRMIRRIFGDAFAAKQVPGLDDKHWTSGLLGKRVIAFPDCSNSAFITSGLFKNLTGNDPIDINPKNKAMFTADLNCKYIFLSNRKPDIQDLMADKRRLILCEMTDIKNDIQCEETSYEEKLWQECGAFLSTCLNLYKSNISIFRPIPIEQDGMNEIIEDKNEEFESYLENNYVIDPDSYIPSSDFWPSISVISWNERKRREFRSFLLKKYSIKRGCKKQDGKVFKAYFGIRIKHYG